MKTLLFGALVLSAVSSFASEDSGTLYRLEAGAYKLTLIKVDGGYYLKKSIGEEVSKAFGSRIIEDFRLTTKKDDDQCLVSINFLEHKSDKDITYNFDLGGFVKYNDDFARLFKARTDKDLETICN